MIDYYKVLKVRRNASGAEIKSAYRKWAREFHPDLNKSNEASRQFSRVALAYQILGDQQSRVSYDEAYRRWRGNGAHFTFSGSGQNRENIRRVYRQQAIDRTVDRLLGMDRKENLALQKAVYPCVTLFLSTFFAAAFRPMFYSHSNVFVRPVVLTLFIIGMVHLGSRLRFYFMHFARGSANTHELGCSRNSMLFSVCSFLIIGLAISFTAGLILGRQLSDYIILAAMPSFFDRQIRPELLLYPPIAVLVVDTVHCVVRKLDL